ncbi:polymorphic toxin type 44 domain-containing protein [Nocardia sp. NPDC057030]|uniref:polymorphic toxin type 44 domain-containing protein n=1 Tax=unclassified Nocardia TaxID=2637762 RepID=UPI003628065C
MDDYDAQPLWDIADTLHHLGPKVENLFERYVSTVAAPGWQGAAAEAAQDRAGRDRKIAYAMADAVVDCARRLEQGYWDVNTPLKAARQHIISAEAAGFTVGPSLRVSVPPDSHPTSALERARAEWERQILTTANAVETEDRRLHRDLAKLSTAMQVVFETIGGSQTTLDEVRFAAAERFIFDEMKRNIDSDTVESIRTLLHKPRWYEFGRDYGSDVRTALVMWGQKVAPNQEWDHKPQLKKRFHLETPDDFYFKQPGTDRKVFYDIYSNMHYGYVGRAAGIDASTLIEGASLGEQILTGDDDAADQITMRAGIELYDKYGPDMTAEQFHRGVIQAIDKLETAEREGRDLTQFRHEN